MKEGFGVGSISGTYRKILREYIRISSIGMPREKRYTKEFLLNADEQELERIAGKFKEENLFRACFNAGVAVGNFLNDPNVGTDELNAGIGGIDEIKDFFWADERNKCASLDISGLNALERNELEKAMAGRGIDAETAWEVIWDYEKRIDDLKKAYEKHKRLIKPLFDRRYRMESSSVKWRRNRFSNTETTETEKVRQKMPLMRCEMSKAIAVLDMPECCGECFFCGDIQELSVGDGLYKKISRCLLAEDVEDPWRDLRWQSKHKEDWCPLKPAPEPQLIWLGNEMEMTIKT